MKIKKTPVKRLAVPVRVFPIFCHSSNDRGTWTSPLSGAVNKNVVGIYRQPLGLALDVMQKQPKRKPVLSAVAGTLSVAIAGVIWGGTDSVTPQYLREELVAVTLYCSDVVSTQACTSL